MSEQCKRVVDYEQARNESVSCYWKDPEHGWHLLLLDPITETILAGLRLHSIEEHEDGTISVQPSIKVSDSRVVRHGYLTRGVWTEC